MKQQQYLAEGTIELPYIPLQFAYSQTIGSKKNEHQQKSAYCYKYKDILTPRILPHHNPFFYLLFHTPSTYNWLRTINTNQSKLLDSYIRLNPTKGESKISVFNIDFFHKSFEQYVKKWEVVKLSFCFKVYVKRQISGAKLCSHLVKTEVYTHQIQYSWNLKQFYFPRVYCKQCQTSISFDCEVKQYSHILILQNPSNPKISLSELKYNYQMYFLMNEHQIYIKCANQVWYEVNMKEKTCKPVSLTNINIKSMKIGAYTRQFITESPIQLSKPFIEQQIPIKHEKIQEQIVEDQKKMDKTTLKASDKLKHQQNKTKNQPKKKTQLKQLKKQFNQVVIKGTSKQYIKQVEKMHTTPKVKDQYQLNYDKGKLKKIKEKKEYIQPDYNQIYQKVKSRSLNNELPQKEGKKIKKQKRKDKRELKTKNQDESQNEQ